MNPDSVTWSGLARHTLGIALLSVTVFLWTASSFLASTIFADDTFSKPYFVTYFTTSLFSSFLIVRLVARGIKECLLSRGSSDSKRASEQSAAQGESESFLSPEGDAARRREPSASPSAHDAPDRLDLRATIRLSLEFGLLWFVANFFQSKSLEYTSVGSATILFSTSPVWTLIYGSWIGVESFTVKKLLGVTASLLGVALIALGDFSGKSDEYRGKFPHKSPGEIAVGDLLAVTSSILYAIYTTRFKKRVGDESRVDMLLFLGFVGVANALFLWPGFFLLDFVGLEKFEWPSTASVQEIILINAVISVISDLTWAYAVVLTTPLVVTVGLSLSIPLSIIGQIFINAQGSTISNWIGAGIVLVAFIIVNREERDDPEATTVRPRQD